MLRAYSLSNHACGNTITKKFDNQAPLSLPSYPTLSCRLNLDTTMTMLAHNGGPKGVEKK